jgi:hypothetical protein
MAVQNWRDSPQDPPQIDPAEIRVGDVIFRLDRTHLCYTVKMISGPQTGPRQWTFFGRDERGLQHTDTYREGQSVRRYAKAS